MINKYQRLYHILTQYLTYLNKILAGSNLIPSLISKTYANLTDKEESEISKVE